MGYLLAGVGSRTGPPAEWAKYRKLWEHLAHYGHGLVSGGCPSGGDQHAYLGMRAAGGPVRLHLDTQLHGGRAYPGAELVWHDAHNDPLYDVAATYRAKQGRPMGQYGGYFVRNAWVAHDGDALIGWRFGDSAGTTHTALMAKQHFHKPVLLLDLHPEATQTASSLIVFVSRVLETWAAQGRLPS